MTCTFLTDDQGKTVAIACGPGGYSHLVMASCPFCCLGDDQQIHAFREVHSGYSAPDLICGSCGQYHSEDFEGDNPKMSEDQREENKAKVADMQARGIAVGDWPSASILEMDEEPPTQDRSKP